MSATIQQTEPLSIPERDALVALIKGHVAANYDEEDNGNGYWNKRILAPMYALLLRYELTLRRFEIASSRPSLKEGSEE